MGRYIQLSSLLLITAGLGCQTSIAAGTGPQTVIEISAGDYHFMAPDTIRNGLVTIRSRNTGTELHHVQIVRLDGTRTLADLAAEMDGELVPSWARQVGGVGAVAAGDSAAVTLKLAPGRYALICFIPSRDGVPHYARGMMRALQVVASETDAATPRADLVMVLDDYRFELSGSLRRGTQTIEVTNAGVQPHEVVLARLEPGYSAVEFVEWFFSGATGPARGQWMGGTVGLHRGERNWITVTLDRGTYGLLCFLPDHVDGRMHLEHGMVREITVD